MLLALKLSTILYMIALGQLDIVVYRSLDVGHHVAQCPVGGVGRDDYLALGVLAVDGVGAGARYDVGHIGQRHLASVLRVDDQVAYFVVVGGLDHQVERSARLVHLRYGLARQIDSQKLVELGQRDAVACQQFAPWHYLEFRTLYLLFHVEVGDAVDVLAGLLDLVAYGVHLVQVAAKELDGYACLRARQHGVDAVGYGLTYLDVGARQHRQALPHVVLHLFVPAVFELERSFYLAHVDAQRMLVELGAACLACHGGYLGHLQQEPLRPCAYGVALFERDARERRYVDGKRALIELGQEAAT